MHTRGARTRHLQGRCPVCGRATEARFEPFCSRRCADEDLARWLQGAYLIPGEEPASPEEDVGSDDDPEAS